jgi:hypothetical protein
MGANPFLLCVLLLAPSLSASATAPIDFAAHPPLAGHSLGEALHLLREAGWPVVFSSRLVRDGMRVAAEPRGDSPRALLADLLAPHDLAVRDGARDRWVVVADPRPRRAEARPPTARGADDSPPVDAPAAKVVERIVVTPDRRSGRGSTTVLFPLASSADEAPPAIGDDIMSSVAVLPGATSSEGSAQVNVRGGGDDDVLIRLDGLELVRPYHLGDFDHALSFVAPTAVERAELFTGAFPAQYGNRMSGVVDLVTRDPGRERHFSLGLGTVSVDAAVSGEAGDWTRWLVTGRAGSYALPLEISGVDQEPRYWDTFGKVDLDVGPHQTLVADALLAHDRFELSSEHHREDETYTSAWTNTYWWVRHTMVIGRDLYAETVAGTGRVDHERSGRSIATENPYAAHDRRGLESLTARQDWHWEAGHTGALEWGFDFEHSNTRLDYASDRGFLRALDPVRVASLVDTRIVDRFDSASTAAYASTELHPTRRLYLELGLRHDTLALADERNTSPRVAATWELGSKTVMRGSWGWFSQSQRPYELQLEEGDADGIAGFASERAEHRQLSLEHQFAGNMTFEVTAYRRRLLAPRVRFENLFEPVLVFPELAEDRVRIAPEGGESQGIEITARQPRRGRIGWWATLTESSITDEIDGRLVPRSNDQPTSFRAALNVRAGRGWDVDLLWQYHTGWPTTAVEAQRSTSSFGTEEWIAVLGSRNAERLPDYHRLDLRVGHSWPLRLGRLDAHFDLLDVYDRSNLRGFENVRIVPDGAGGAQVMRDPVTWAGLVPAFGLRWSL